ncbi:response regulator [Sphingosinicella sp. BN140058]|uniref:response regulator n=1 Tax=Sphingosinicella sp. BN140058 TaxID=1892855 RepID=UPI00198014E0|nr:response regulator [Sphingosinicella sp. BN140058]
MLLVEDDSAVRRALQLMLQGQGYDVRSYRSGLGLAKDAEALQAFCLVADLCMPEKNALELLRDLRGAGWGGGAILISGHLNDSDRIQAREEGYDVVLAKPLQENVLKRAVAGLVAPAARLP